MTPSECPLGQFYFYDPCESPVAGYWTNVNIISSGGRYKAPTPSGGAATTGNLTRSGITGLFGLAATVRVDWHLENSSGANWEIFALKDSSTATGKGIVIRASLITFGAFTLQIEYYNGSFGGSPAVTEVIYNAVPPNPFDFDQTWEFEIVKSGSDILYKRDGVIKYTAIGASLSTQARLEYTNGEIPSEPIRQALAETLDIRVLDPSQTSNPCLGSNPTKSQLLPSGTGKIAAARILKGYRGEEGAQAFHEFIQRST